MKGETRKKQIINASIKQFAKLGYHRTHIENVLKEAKIGKGTFYIYFKNKEDLFVAVLEKFFFDWEEFVLVNSDENARYDDENYHRNVVKRSLTFFEKNKDICNIYPCIAPGFNEFFEPYIEKFESKILQDVTNLLKKGVAAGFYRNDFDIELIANIFVGAHMRIAYNYFASKKKIKRLSVDQLSDQLYNFVFKGIHA